MRGRILFVWHLTWLTILAYAFSLQNESCRLVPEELNRCLTFGGRYIFMTHILQASSKLTYALFVGSYVAPKVISASLPKWLWSRLVLPLTWVVCLMYHLLFSIDPNLVRNPLTVQYIPQNLDFLLHTAIVPGALVESLLGAHQIKISASMRTMTCFMVAYSAWAVLTHYVSAKWPYGVIEKVGMWPAMGVFIPVCLLLALIGLAITTRLATFTNWALKTDQNQNLRLTVSKKNI